MMGKKKCETEKKGSTITKDKKFVCKSCGHKSNNKDKLCKPVKA